MAPNSLWVTAVFGINIFVFFGKKPNNCEFTAVHHVLSELFTKSILHFVIPFCVIFLTKNKVVPLVFFRFRSKIMIFEFTLLHHVLSELLKNPILPIKIPF